MIRNEINFLMYTILRCAQEIAGRKIDYTSLLGVYQSKRLSSIGKWVGIIITLCSNEEKKYYDLII